VRVEHVAAYLAGQGPVTRFWHRKASALQGLYRFAMGRGYVGCSPLPPTLPKPQSVFTPYIYTPEELQRLLQGAEAGASPWAKLSTTTVRTLLLLLYGAALRISEALALTLADVDLAASLLSIRTSKFYKTRWVPIGPRLCATLAAYACERPPSLLLQTPAAPFS
jgi:integrase/recombinase XerD